MKYRLTSGKVYGPDGAMPVGSILEIKGEVPPGLVGRVERVEEKPAKADKDAVTAQDGKRKKWSKD